MSAKPIIRLPLADLPAGCEACGHQGSEWPLSIYGLVLCVSCPACFAVVAPVHAVRSEQS